MRSSGEKRCPTCEVVKPSIGFHKNRSSKDGLQYSCITCKQRTKRACDLRRRYGITVDEYKALAAAQGGVCAICREACTSGRRLAVDHCHETGEVRGLLCYNCNRGIGHLQDDPSLARSAAAYLEGGAECSETE